jgi:hypothetical protein
MTFNHEGQSLNSTYRELQITGNIMNKVDKSTRIHGRDYAGRDSRSFSAELGHGKPGLFKRLISLLTTPMEV